MRNLIISIILITISQTLSYIQTQSQFFSKWSRDNPIFMVLLGIPISLLLIYFTKYCSLYFNGQTWPGRLIGFAIGAIVFALLSYFIMNEQFTTKTIICLILSACILLIQILWK
jgi:hypothetical protein